ncbi:hypothetical protein [Veillonella sp. VA142]|uniref:hypothetical protein n=1 Tax=Veillonella sp. VA142 TaxID=741834 RepID=UPI000F8E9F4F|nr:hypothetical protein [Veillonella sp. VA142]
MKVTSTMLLKWAGLQKKLLFDCTGRWAGYLRSKWPKKRIVGIDKAVDLVVMGLIRKNKGK